MTMNPQAARLEEIARINTRERPQCKQAPLDVTLPELALAIIAALLLSLICC
ncbi:MAG: hypothetical protein IJ418_01905 [Clostridia bacterium]|nr:hypothetical protein [Clostridia bacterium]MBQ8616244.1 hypothetical protein [Clostridia bacterium]